MVALSTVAPVKNRVGDFFSWSLDCSSETSTQVVDCDWEITHQNYDTRRSPSLTQSSQGLNTPLANLFPKGVVPVEMLVFYGSTGTVGTTIFGHAEGNIGVIVPTDGLTLQDVVSYVTKDFKGIYDRHGLSTLMNTRLFLHGQAAPLIGGGAVAEGGGQFGIGFNLSHTETGDSFFWTAHIEAGGGAGFGLAGAFDLAVDLSEGRITGFGAGKGRINVEVGGYVAGGIAPNLFFAFPSANEVRRYFNDD